MIAKNLSAADMCAATGSTEKRLRILVEEGVLEPVEGGDGRGSHRRFALNQAIALAVICDLAEAGWRGSALAIVPEFLASLYEEELLAEFRAGRTHLWIAPGKVALIDPPQRKGFELLDVEKTYRKVVRAIRKIEKELNPHSGIGRRRGLAETM